MVTVEQAPPITLGRVIEAYQRTKLKPIARQFYKELEDGTQCGCLITVLAVDSGHFTAQEVSEFADREHENLNYFNSFIGLPENFNLEHLYDGFDKNGCHKDTDEYALGESIFNGLKAANMIGEDGKWVI